MLRQRLLLPAGVVGGAGLEGLSGRARGYLEVVRDLNRAQTAHEAFDPADCFRAAAAAEPASAPLTLEISSSCRTEVLAWDKALTAS